MDRPNSQRLFEIASEQGGYFTSAQARAAGFSWALLTHHAKTGRFVRVRRGLYRLREYPSFPREEVLAAWLAVGKDAAVVSHESALDLLDLSDVIPDAVHLTVPRSHRNRSPIPGVRVHTTTTPPGPTERVVRGGAPVTTASRTILDAAAAGTAPEQIELAVRQAIGRGIATPDELRRGARARGRRVAALVERALATAARVPLSAGRQPVGGVRGRYSRRDGADGLTMLAAEDIRLVEETARALHAQGEAERARAIEAVLAAAKSTLRTADGLGLPEYLTTKDVARSLSLRHQVVLKWVAAGELATVDRAGQKVVRRDALVAFLEDLRRRSPEARPVGSAEAEAARRQHEWVLAGLPEEQRSRLEGLHAKMEAGRRLARAERDEMTALQHQLAAAAASRLEEWIRGQPAATT